MILILMLFSQIVNASVSDPVPFPVFLKLGYSSVLEFEEAPTQVVLGDSSAFQIERLDRSIVIKPLSNYATTNMFVYFKTKSTRLFILSASEDAEPTYHKKFETLPAVVTKKEAKILAREKRGASVTRITFDKKKDYLKVDILLSADSSGKITPAWDLVRLKFKDAAIAPKKVWSERKEILRDSSVRASFIFSKPNIPANLDGVSLVVPVKGSTKSLNLQLKKV